MFCNQVLLFIILNPDGVAPQVPNLCPSNSFEPCLYVRLTLARFYSQEYLHNKLLYFIL